MRGKGGGGGCRGGLFFAILQLLGPSLSGLSKFNVMQYMYLQIPLLLSFYPQPCDLTCNHRSEIFWTELLYMITHAFCSYTCNIKKKSERIKLLHLKCPLKFQCLHPFSQSKISLLLNIAVQVSFVMHLGPLSQLCFGSKSPVVSAQTEVCWSLPTLTEVKLENTDVKLAIIVGVQ